jgi:hypothetical protein
MNIDLPEVEELEKLTMRAAIAYAARVSRRLRPALQGVVASDLIDDVLGLVENVSTMNCISNVDRGLIITAAQRVVEAYAAAPITATSREKSLIVFSLVQSALAATNVIEAAVNPERSRDCMKRVASQAQRAARPIEALDDVAASAASEAARRDYSALLQVYGEHDNVTIGEPVDYSRLGEE